MKQSIDKESVNALVTYRLQHAKDTFAEVGSITDSGFYNTAVNRLYYACYYAVIALLVKHNIPAQTHAGVKQMLGLHFVTTKKLNPEYARFYAQMFNNRISGDYDDFITFDLEMIEELKPQAQLFIDAIEKLIIENA
ncbi:MAG: HEPN domain-containing protein [Bacteroidales bacterium]